MFWSSAATSSNIETVLDQPDVTLRTVLEQDEILQELRALNKKLVEFLTRPESMSGMIDLVTTEPPDDLPLAAQYKLPNVACEVLTCENTFAEKITSEKSFLEKLFYFFRDKPSPINPLLASYACRVLGEIITRKLDQNWYSYQLNLIQIMGYLQSEPGVLQWLLNHLDCSAVCEFYYKLIMNVEGQDMRNSLFDWMVEREKIIIRLMEKMTRNDSGDVHANISRLVGDLLFAFQDELINSTQDRSTDADPFLLALKSHETINTLLNVLFSQDAICETSVMHGLDLVLALLGITRKCPRQSGRNDSLDEDNEGVQISDPVKQDLLSLMPTLLKLIESPVDPYSIPLTYGVLEKPVGLGRLAIAKFIAHLFTLEDDQLNMGMIESGVLKQLLDLFWENPWNNFLHRYVCKILTCIAKASNSPGSASYLMDIGILSKILEVFENKELKCGYRGHLAKVASVWGECAILEGHIKDLMKTLEETNGDFYSKWDAFYSDTLESYLSEEKVLLAGVHPPASGGLLSNPPMPYGTEPSGAMWEGFAAAAHSILNMNADFDNQITDTFSSVMDGFDESKARSIFEIYCHDKANTFGDEDDDDDSPKIRNDSFDIGSPDEDSLDEDRWNEHEERLNISGDDLFGKEHEVDDNSPTTPTDGIPVLGLDPWSGLDPISAGAGDPWSNTEPDSAADPSSSTDADWAKFDVDKKTSPTSPKGGDVEWASFESALAACSIASSPPQPVVNDKNKEQPKNVNIESSAAKDEETVSASSAPQEENPKEKSNEEQKS